MASVDPCLYRTFTGHKGPLHGLAFNESGSQIAAGSEDRCVYVWNMRPQIRALRFLGHTVLN